MEGDEIIFTSIDSLWFYSSVLRPSPKQSSEVLPQPRKQDNTEIHELDGDDGASTPHPKCVADEEAAAGGKKRTEARGRGLNERTETRQEEQWRHTQTRVVAVPARCSPSPAMPPPSDGHAMKAHLRSWAQAVACSVR